MFADDVSRTLKKGHIDSHRGPPSPVCSSIFRELSALRTRVRHRWSALFAPPPSRKAVISWYFLCSSCQCNCTNLLLKKRFCCETVVERITHRPRMSSLPCLGMTTAHVRPEALLGIAKVACNETATARAPTFRSRRQQLCLRHRERLWSSGRNSDGPRFYIRTEGSGAFLFRASSRHPSVWAPLVEAPDHSDRRANCDEAALPCVGLISLCGASGGVLLS